MRPSHRAASSDPEPYGRAARQPHEPGHIRCEVCGRDVYYTRVPGRHRKTCGARACIRIYRHRHGIGNAICAHAPTPTVTQAEQPACDRFHAPARRP